MRILGESMPPPDLVSYEDYREYVTHLPYEISRHIYHRVVHTEEESVGYVRAVEAPREEEGPGIALIENPGGSLPLTVDLCPPTP